MEINSRELEGRVTLEALDPTFRITFYNSLTNSLFPLMVVAVMWPVVDHGILVMWCSLFIVAIAARYSLAVAYAKQDVTWVDAKLWADRLSLISLPAATLWASTVFFFYVDGSVEYQVFLFTLLIALSVGSVIAGLYWLPHFYLRAVPIIGALVVRLMLEGTFVYMALAAMLLAALAGTSVMAKKLNETMRSEIRLRHESAALNYSLRAKTQEAQQATEAKSKFLAAASHDLRQPLHTLSLFIDVLKESKNKDERESIFPRIDLSLDALRKLFDALLDISKLDAKVVKPEISHFDLAKLLKEVAEEFLPVANKNKLKLIVHANSLVVVSDRLLLERILRNLVGNAIRYTQEGGILISARARGDNILLQVWDTGIGIPQESKDDVFTEFQQLHNVHRDRTQGLGLGLAIVRRLCLLLDHPLDLRSECGKGSVFSVSLPVGRSEMISTSDPDNIIHQWDLSGRRIIVIDDELDTLDAMHSLLSRWGCDVITAESLEEALHSLNINRIVPELILSDLRLRNNIAGIDVIDGLRNWFASPIPGILITGETSPEQIKMAKDSGYPVLQKPVKPMRLRAVIHHYLSEADS